jgi:hypothetical protein
VAVGSVGAGAFTRPGDAFARCAVVERATRIELAFSAWEADVLPLNYARVVLPGFY